MKERGRFLRPKRQRTRRWAGLGIMGTVLSGKALPPVASLCHRESLSVGIEVPREEGICCADWCTRLDIHEPHEPED